MQTLPTRDGESQAFMLPSSFSKNIIISPRSALARSDDLLLVESVDRIGS